MVLAVGLTGMGVNLAWGNGNDVFVVFVVGSARASFAIIFL